MVLSFTQSIPGYLIHTAFSWAARLVSIWKLVWCGCSEILVFRSLMPWWWRSQGDWQLIVLTYCLQNWKQRKWEYFQQHQSWTGSKAWAWVLWHQLLSGEGLAAVLMGAAVPMGMSRKADQNEKGRFFSLRKKDSQIGSDRSAQIHLSCGKTGLGRIIGHLMKWLESQNK